MMALQHRAEFFYRLAVCLNGLTVTDKVQSASQGPLLKFDTADGGVFAGHRITSGQA